MGSRIGPGVLLGCRVEQTALSALPVPSSKSLLFRHLGVQGCIFPVNAEAGIRPRAGEAADMGAPDEIGWPTLPEVYSPAVEGGGGRPSTYSTRLPPFTRWRCTATASCSFQLPLQTMPPMPLASCHLPRLLGPFGLSLYAGLYTAHLVLYCTLTRYMSVGFARRSGAWPSLVWYL